MDTTFNMMLPWRFLISRLSRDFYERAKRARRASPTNSIRGEFGEFKGAAAPGGERAVEDGDILIN